MRRLSSRASAATTIAALVLLTAGCVPEPAGDAATPEPTTAPTAPATPSATPSATLEIPDAQPGEIARAVFTPDGGPGDTPQTSYISSDILPADAPFAVVGECIGDSVDYQVVRAAVGDSGGVLLSGTLECGAPAEAAYYSTPFEGPVQLALISTDDIQQGWLAVVPGVSG